MAARSSQIEVEGEGDERGDGVEVAMFDHSVDNFFSDMDNICELSSSPSKHDLDLADINRFSSMITFLKEWKYFEYEPRTVSFPCESERVATGTSPDHVRRELKLPQFSSAAIPKARNLVGEADSSRSDFVLYAGGSVWALDWCPRSDDKHDPAITCEYLAVSAHPPGSNYHKMGASLKGRGAIQIWCLLTATETVELLTPSHRVAKKLPVTKHRGRPRKKPIEEDACSKVPKKRPIEEDACSQVPKKRGRPRKNVPCSNEKEDELLSLVTFNLEGTASAFALPPPPDASSNGKGSNDQTENFQNQGARPVVSGACAKVPKKRGRPRKNVPCSNEKEDELLSLVDFDLEKTSTALVLPPPPDTSSNEKGSNDKTENFQNQDACPVASGACAKVPKRRGRPRKNVPCSNEKKDDLLSLVNFNLEGTATALALPPPPDASSNEKGSNDKTENFRNQEACPVVSGAKLNEDLDKGLWNLKMAQEGRNVATDNEANIFPIVEPLDFELPLSVLYEKNCDKRRLKAKRSKKKPDFVAAESSRVQDVTSADCQIVEFNSVETEYNAEVKLANSVSCRKETQLPKLVFCLAHYGKVAWDIKWKPFVTSSTARMGYLAVLLGNGSLEVWEVPVPRTVQRVYSSIPSRGDGTDPRFLKLKSVFRCSKLTFGNRQSIPLTLEWSPAPPGDMILAGCHDGTVALWKFAINAPSEDSRPVLIFTADSSPIRSLAWAPHDSENTEDANLFVVAGTEGLKFWDIRDPYHSLWEVNPAHRAVLSVDWLKNPRCILMSLEDGTMRVFSLPKGANDLPVTGMPLPKKQFEGLVAYCVTDGSVVVFQLNERFLEPDPTRNRTRYFSCDNLKEEGGILELGPSFRNTIIPNLPLKPIKGPGRYNMGDDKAIVLAAHPPPKENEENNANIGMSYEVDDDCYNAFPSKLVALQKVRWNRNKGAKNWLCYGGAAGKIDNSAGSKHIELDNC